MHIEPSQPYVSDGVARELYPVALAQARTLAVFQVAVIAAYLGLWVSLGFPQQYAWSVAIIAPGLFATVRDVRWWLWLRRADAMEAHRRLEERDELGSPPRSRWAPMLLSLVLFNLWWFLASA